MNDLLSDIRNSLLAAPDTVCLDRATLVTRAHRLFGDQPAPVARARMLDHILRNMALDVESNPYFAGNTSSRPRAWMLMPEHGLGVPGQALVENPALAGILDGPAVPDEIRAYWEGRSTGTGSNLGHLAVDLQAVVHRGLGALDADIAALQAAPEPQQQYRQAMRIALAAVRAWAHRYADAADVAAASADQRRAALLRRVAAACRRVPWEPAQDLFEALQSIVLVHLAVHVEGHGYSVSIGLLDRVLAAFAGEVEADRENAVELLCAFMLKIAANSVWGSHSKTQAITIGGADAQGRDACNVVTDCVLEACDRVRLGDPHVFLRWHAHLSQAVAERACCMLTAGVSMPLLVNDEPTVRGMVDAGVRFEDAAEYCIVGCNELGIPARLWESGVGAAVVYPEVINEAVLSDGAVGDMAALISRVEGVLSRKLAARMREFARRCNEEATRLPTPLTSALMRGCGQQGKDLRAWSPYPLPGLYERGLTNAINALAAIEDVVFVRRELSFDELRQALREDRADVLELLRSGPRWGADDSRADKWATVLLEMRDRCASSCGCQVLACHVVRSLHHVSGASMGATPDGRRARAPLADSVGAEKGTAVGGPAAMLNSVLRIDAAKHYRGGYNLNLSLPVHTSSPALVRALIDGFFGQGGQELQVACLDVGTLRKAKEHPELHGDLVVRVAGFSALFVKLSPVQQDELIARAELARQVS